MMKGFVKMKYKESKREKRKRIAVIICALTVVFALVFSIFYPVLTQTNTVKAATKAELQKSAEQAKKKTEEAKKQLNTVKQNKANVSKEVLSIDAEINRAEDELAETEQAIEKARVDIVVKEQELLAAEASCEKYDEEFKMRARAMYEDGTTSYMEVLLGASSFSDLMSRVDMIQEVVEYDKRMLASLSAAREEIRIKKEAVETEKANLESRETELEALREELEYRLESKQLLLNQLMADEEEYKKAYEQAEADEKKIQRELERKAAEEAKSGTGTKYTGNGQFQWPCPSSRRITSYYGYRIHPVYKTKKFHSGIDIGAGYGNDIVAAESGTVITATYGSGYGKYVVISHGSGITTLYGHCSSLLVKVGDKVQKGQTIAKIGSTGVSTGNHLHFEVRINGSTTDPLSYVN